MAIPTIIHMAGHTLMAVFAQMHFQAMAVLGLIGAVLALKRVHRLVRFDMRVEHGFIDAFVFAYFTLKRLLLLVIAHMILQMVFIFGHKPANTRQLFVLGDVRLQVLPVLLFAPADVPIAALLALVGFGPIGASWRCLILLQLFSCASIILSRAAWQHFIELANSILNSF